MIALPGNRYANGTTLNVILLVVVMGPYADFGRYGSTMYGRILEVPVGRGLLGRVS